MGSGASKPGTNGVTLPARFRPVFLQRLEEFTARRHNRPLKDHATPSRKELLLQERYDNDNASISSHPHDDVVKTTRTYPHVNTVSPGNKHQEADKPRHEAHNLKHERSKEERLETKGKDDAKEKAKDEDTEEDVFKDFDEDDDDYDDEHEGRMIGNRDSDAFPGSPSFRVYFNYSEDDNHSVNGKDEDDSKSKATCDDAKTPEDSSVSKESKGRTKKKRSFKHVFPKGGQAAVKNLLNVTSCYTPSHSSNDRNRLLTDHHKAAH